MGKQKIGSAPSLDEKDEASTLIIENDSSLQKLETTQNYPVPKQEPRNIIPVFINLKSLEIIRCSSLRSLFTISSAKSLKRLELLKLYGCKNMVCVLEEGSGGIEGSTAEQAAAVAFPKLNCLILKHLPSLTSFCEHDCHLEWPELQLVRVKDIPKMSTFSKGSLIRTPKLKQVYVTYVTKCWQGGLNTTIEYLHEHYYDFMQKYDSSTGESNKEMTTNESNEKMITNENNEKMARNLASKFAVLNL